MKRNLVAMLIVVAVLLLAVAQDAMAQDMCLGDFDYDGDIDGSDIAVIKSHFGRSEFDNPCPPDGPAPVPETGQLASYATGDDGDLEKGVHWPKPRFTNNGDGTVTDNLTGLIWLRDAGCWVDGRWTQVLAFCNGLSSGDCGLTDGSQAGDWRLPNYKELFSLVSARHYDPALPSAHPFVDVSSNPYWTSTSYVGSTGTSWCVDMLDGDVLTQTQGTYLRFWPVRGGH